MRRPLCVVCADRPGTVEKLDADDLIGLLFSTTWFCRRCERSWMRCTSTVPMVAWACRRARLFERGRNRGAK